MKNLRYIIMKYRCNIRMKCLRKIRMKYFRYTMLKFSKNTRYRRYIKKKYLKNIIMI